MARAAPVWDPAQYLRFADERLRPALDLLRSHDAWFADLPGAEVRAGIPRQALHQHVAYVPDTPHYSLR